MGKYFEDGGEKRQGRSVNVHYQRVDHISEWINFYYPTTTILKYTTTILATNYNYIRSS